MADQGSLNQLLQWSINNSNNTSSDPSNTNNAPSDPTRGLSAAALSELLGGPSDADLMRMSMTTIISPKAPLEDKETAWDNFKQLIENLDNANNMQPLGLWAPLLEQLLDPEPENRRMAAWCVSTAVQNNVKSQEFCLAAGGVEKLVRVVREDARLSVRKKAVSALSSEVRNFQAGLDELMRVLPKELGGAQKGLDAGDMAAVDGVVQRLREHTEGAE